MISRSDDEPKDRLAANQGLNFAVVAVVARARQADKKKADPVGPALLTVLTEI